MTTLFRPDISASQPNCYVKLVLWCLQPKWGAVWSLGFLTLSGTGLQAATENIVSPPVLENWNSPLELTPQPEKLDPEPHSSIENYSVRQRYELQPAPFLIAGPNNFNPNLRVEPPPSTPSTPTAQLQTSPPSSTPTASPSPQTPLPPTSLPSPSPEPTAPTASPEQNRPAIALENITTNFRYDNDNFDRQNLFIEPTTQFRLQNGNIIRFKTGFNSFSQPEVDSITNIPLQVGYETKIGSTTVQAGAGVDLFNRLPTALNFNARADFPITPSFTLSGLVEQGPYKFNAETLENQITAWRYGPQLYWQIDPKTSLFSFLRLGNYNDGNFEEQSFTRLERKFGQFYVAANLFNWSYAKDVQETSGYFSPPDFLVFNGEVGLNAELFDFLSCRVAASLGRQRLNGEFDNANSYEARCTGRLSPNVDADFGYLFTNVRNQETGGSAYNNNSFTGQVRVKF